MTTWGTTLARRRGLTLASLGALTDLELAAEIANLQWEIVIETAQAAMYPKDERGPALTRLRQSTSILDRHAAALVDRWIDEERRSR